MLNVCKGRSSVLVLLDLSAAFDTIDHKILLEGVSRFGVRDSAFIIIIIITSQTVTPTGKL